jgi:hypothetical protein
MYNMDIEIRYRLRSSAGKISRTRLLLPISLSFDQGGRLKSNQL